MKTRCSSCTIVCVVLQWKRKQDGPSSGVKLDLKWVLEKNPAPKKSFWAFDSGTLGTFCPLTPSAPFKPWHPWQLLNSDTLSTFCPLKPWHLFILTLLIQYITARYSSVGYSDILYCNLVSLFWVVSWKFKNEEYSKHMLYHPWWYLALYCSSLPCDTDQKQRIL